MIFDTRPASADRLGACEPPFTVYVLHDPRQEIAIGMTDHSANGARDPPLHHRLDPFYPQPPADGDLFARQAAIAVRSRALPHRCALANRLYLVIHGRSFIYMPGSRGDPCDLTPSPYNLRPTCDTWFLIWCVISQTGFCGDHGPIAGLTRRWQATR